MNSAYAKNRYRNTTKASLRTGLRKTMNKKNATKMATEIMRKVKSKAKQRQKPYVELFEKLTKPGLIEQLQTLDPDTANDASEICLCIH